MLDYVGAIENNSFERRVISSENSERTAPLSLDLFCGGAQGPVTLIVGDGRVYHQTDYSQNCAGTSFEEHSRHFLENYVTELQRRGGFDTIFLQALQRKRNDSL